MVGMWLGANAPNRVNKLILSNTSSYMADSAPWEARIKAAREQGLAALAEGTLERWFTKPFRERAPEAVERIRKMFVDTDVDGYVGCVEAIRAMDHRPLLAKISAPTLVIAGRHDPGTTLEAGEYIAQHIPGARLAVLEAAHISNVEQPQAYNDAALGFLLGK